MSEREEEIEWVLAENKYGPRDAMRGFHGYNVRGMAVDIIALRQRVSELGEQLAAADRELKIAKVCNDSQAEHINTLTLAKQTAERERDEARRERDAVQQRHDANVAGIIEAVCDLINAEVVPKGSKSLGDAVQGALTALREARHRAERAERVVEAARKWLADLWRGDLNGTVIGVCMDYEPDGQYALWEQVAPIAAAVRALDAAEGTNA